MKLKMMNLKNYYETLSGSMKMGKILFTGGNGFLGRQLIPLLEED